MPNVFFTSDLHLGHENIIEYCARPFANVSEMDEALIENFNSRVKPTDDAWILGDFCFKVSKEKAQRYLRPLNGNKHLIVGNHDFNWKKLGGFSSVETIEMLNLPGFKAILCHYPFCEWMQEDKGRFMLHGHQHWTQDYNKTQRKLGIRRFDVGVDANNYTPVSMDEIKDFFKDVPGKSPWEQAWKPCTSISHFA